MKTKVIFTLSRVAVALVLLVSFHARAAVLEQVRDHYASGSLRVVFDLDGKSAFTFSHRKRLNSLILEIDSAQAQPKFQFLLKKNSIVRTVSHKFNSQKNTLSVFFQLARPVAVNVFDLDPAGMYGHRVVVDFKAMSAEEVQKDLKPDQTEVSPKHIVERKPTILRDLVIAVDAGHGGRQPGAISTSGLLEKNITLSIAKKLVATLNHQPGLHAILIRDRDVTISLTRRVSLARAARADFFISIHADAFKDPKITGASVYARSDVGGATSEAAAWLASQEKSGVDLTRGIVSKNNVLKKVLVDMTVSTMQKSLVTALDLGSSVLQSLGQVTNLHSRRVEQANFAVLKAPAIPSILVEAGYISNPGEARLLASDGYQQRLSNQIAAGLINFLRNTPPSGLWALRDALPEPVERGVYTVATGDTLYGIARTFKVSPVSIANYNRLTTEHILKIGDVLHIPL